MGVTQRSEAFQGERRLDPGGDLRVEALERGEELAAISLALLHPLFVFVRAAEALWGGDRVNKRRAPAPKVQADA